LDGALPEDTADRHFELPFAVPAGIAELEVRHPVQQTANILDYGLEDPTGFRGWGGGNIEPIVVGLRAASRSYLRGPLPAGTWKLWVSKAKVNAHPARYHVEIALRDTPSLPEQPERRPYAPVPAL